MNINMLLLTVTRCTFEQMYERNTQGLAQGHASIKTIMGNNCPVDDGAQEATCKYTD